MLKNEQFQLYGKTVTGEESELELEKAARKRYLKLKMRESLAHEIGDDPDAITDVLRTVLLCYGVSSGLITDKSVIERVNSYASEMLAGYGGADNMLDVIEFDKEAVGRHVVMGFFKAKAEIDAAKTSEDVRMIDLP